MAIWIHRFDLDTQTAEAIFKECTVVEELSYYDKKRHKKASVVVMVDTQGDYFRVPYRVAKKYGYHQKNTSWKQIVHEQLQKDGSTKYIPEFTGQFRPYQEEVIPEIIKCLQTHNTVIMGLPPGFGKTIITTYLLWMSGLMAACIVKQTKVYTGWQKTFQKVLPDARVWLVGDEPMPEHFDIILCMNGRTHFIPPEIKKQVGTLIIDEVHTITTETQVNNFLDWQPKYIIFESATYKGSKLWKMAKTVADEDGVFRISKTPYNFYVVKTGIMGDVSVSEHTGSIVPAYTQKSLIENHTRKRIIQTIIYNHIQYRKFICLQKLTTDIDNNIGILNNMGISCDTLWGSKNNYDQSLVLFGTYGKVGTGFDEENACDNYWVLPVKSDTGMFINSVASPFLMIQAMGRCMRTENEVPAFIFLLDDNSNVKNHLNSNKWLIELTNGRIINVDYKTPFIGHNPAFGLKFQLKYTSGVCFKILKYHEYQSFHECGFYAGDENERNNNAIIMQIKDSVMYYKKVLCPHTLAYVLQLHECNLCEENGVTVIKDGLVFCRHPIFFRNVIKVDIIT